MDRDQLFQDELLTFKILSSYISENKSKISLLKEEQETVSFEISEFETKLNSLTDISKEDNYVFSPFSNEDLNNRSVDEVNDKLSYLKERKSNISDSIYLLEKNNQELNFILSFIKNTKLYTGDEKVLTSAADQKTSNTVNISSSDKSDEYDICCMLKTCSSLIFSDPVRVKLMIDKYLREHSK